MYKDELDTIECCVITNAKRYYSVWPRERAIPGGWRSIDVVGNAQECIAYIKALSCDNVMPSYTVTRPKIVCDVRGAQA
ncbi:MAG: MbtH family NRPS accessory protein [Chloroflexi bacterium]|nr:MbtH family NRPS accessory protein [Chloroflexota bacterium]